MANTVTGFNQTLVTAATEASATLMGSNALLDRVYKDYQPQVTDIGKTLNVIIPASVTSQVADGGVADVSYSDVVETTVPIVFDQHPLYTFVIRDFEQYNTPRSIRTAFLDAAFKGVAEYIDGKVAALFTSTNFTSTTAIATTGSLITTTQFLSGYATLANNKVAVADPANMSLISVPTVYAKILGDTGWTQALIAGEKIASEVHGSGRLAVSYGCTLDYDQQLTALNTGTAPNQTFTGAYFHRYAVAVATRPLPTPDTAVVDATMIDYKGIPIRVMIGYNQAKLGFVVTVDAGFGLKVVRPEMGQLFATAQ